MAGDSDTTAASSNSATGPIGFGPLELKFGAKTFNNGTKTPTWVYVVALLIAAFFAWRMVRKK